MAIGQETTVDGIERLSSTGIRVLIIGAGVAGLGAALECWRKGCEVTVLERNAEPSSAGDFFTLPPSALANVKYYPRMVDEYNSQVFNCTTSLWSPSGKLLFTRYPEWRRDKPAHPAPTLDVSFLNMRSKWAKMQLNQLQRCGVPVNFGQTVESVHESQDQVIVRTKDGKEYSCDVCMLANGVATKMPGFETEGAMHVVDSGYAAARVAFPRTAIKKDSPAYDIVKDVPEHPDFRVYVGSDVHLILFLTADHVGWVFTHKNDGTAAESWSTLHQAEELLPYLYKANADWDPAVIDFLKQTPRGVVDWQLKLRDSSYKWTSDGGRLLRIGDAAHTFLPTAGNGAVQALEDGMSIAECLRMAGKANVGAATKVHNKLRFERTSILQHAGLLNREELHSIDVEGLIKNPNESPGFFRQGRWVWGHDAEQYARANYSACLAHLENGAPFANTNLPPGHKFEPWTLQSEGARMKAGIPSELKSNGYWGTDANYTVAAA